MTQSASAYDDPRPPASDHDERAAWSASPGNIPRVSAELPRDAREVVERAGVALRGSAYRTHDPAHAGDARWYPVVVRPPPSRGAALVWPTVRTAVPAGASAALLGSLIYLAGTLDAVGIVGTALGGVLSALVARTQYKLEREQHALGSLWLAADYTRVLVGRYDSLGARITGRARWYVVPLEVLCPMDEPRRRTASPPIAGSETTPAEDRAPLPNAAPVEPPVAAVQGDGLMAAWQRWQARVRRVGYALAVLGIDAATVDGFTAGRVHTLARLARFVRFARGV